MLHQPTWGEQGRDGVSQEEKVDNSLKFSDRSKRGAYLVSNDLNKYRVMGILETKARLQLG